MIAASGMCSGRQIINNLKVLITDPRTDLLFVGHQAEGAPGRIIQSYGPRHGWVELDGECYTINAKVESFSAHADQKNLINFVKRMRHKPKEVCWRML